MTLPAITVVIPHIPERAAMLDVAVNSCNLQDYDGEVIVSVQTDTNGLGPAVMRNQGVWAAETEWVAFLDDDDRLLPHHLDTLMTCALATQADLVWPWFTVEGGTDPFPGHRGRQWDPSNPHIFPITVLLRRSAFLAVDGFTVEETYDLEGRRISGEDWRLWLALSAAGAKMVHVNSESWIWVHHTGNSSGVAERRRR